MTFQEDRYKTELRQRIGCVEAQLLTARTRVRTTYSQQVSLAAMEAHLNDLKAELAALDGGETP